ncbi:MAG: hypothetical protein Q4F05_15105 [bacterium]|nr:hypothetical protein [bacterium]
MNNILNVACYCILLTFLFSVFGWCMEVFLKYIQYHRFINRGFLIGPYCPIYGFGALFITFTVGLFAKIESSYGSTFIISLIVCGILEYIVSYYIEKKFHARWWDYSSKPMNLNGRIWIGNLILFGIGGTIIIKIINPVLRVFFFKLSDSALYTISVIICVILISDYVTSHIVMKFVKASVENSEADNTESISKEIRLLLSNRSILYRRITDAYPNVIYRTEKIKDKLQQVKLEMERIKEETTNQVENVEKRFEEQRQNILAMMETTSNIKDEIIQKQETLIGLMEEGKASQQEILSVQSDIEQRKAQLEKRKRMFSINQKGKQ